MTLVFLAQYKMKAKVPFSKDPAHNLRFTIFGGIVQIERCMTLTDHGSWGEWEAVEWTFCAKLPIDSLSK